MAKGEVRLIAIGGCGFLGGYHCLVLLRLVLLMKFVDGKDLAEKEKLTRQLSREATDVFPQLREEVDLEHRKNCYTQIWAGAILTSRKAKHMGMYTGKLTDLICGKQCVSF